MGKYYVITLLLPNGCLHNQSRLFRLFPSFRLSSSRGKGRLFEVQNSPTCVRNGFNIANMANDDIDDHNLLSPLGSVQYIDSIIK